MADPFDAGRRVWNRPPRGPARLNRRAPLAGGLQLFAWGGHADMRNIAGPQGKSMSGAPQTAITPAGRSVRTSAAGGVVSFGAAADFNAGAGDFTALLLGAPGNTLNAWMMSSSSVFNADGYGLLAGRNGVAGGLAGGGATQITINVQGAGAPEAMRQSAGQIAAAVRRAVDRAGRDL